MSLTPRDRFHLAMSCRQTDRPPVCGMAPSSTVDLMMHSGAMWPEAHLDGTLMAIMSLDTPMYLGLESITLPYGLCNEAEALGCVIDWGGRAYSPTVRSSPFSDRFDADLISMDPKDMRKSEGNSAILEALGYIGDGNEGDHPVIVCTTAPFTLSSLLVGAENLILWTLVETDLVDRFITHCADYCATWAEILQEHECIDCIQSSEPTASYDLIDANMFGRFAKPGLQKQFGAVRGPKTALHICGDMTYGIDNLVDTGADALSIEEKCDSSIAIAAAAKRCAMVGNVGTINPLLQGTPARVEKATRHCIDAGFDIIAPGCSLPVSTPLDNIRAMVYTVMNSTR